MITPSTASSVLLNPNSAQAGRAADGYFAHVPHAHRHPILRTDHHVADIPCVANQPESPHVVELPSLRIKAAARMALLIPSCCRIVGTVM